MIRPDALTKDEVFDLQTPRSKARSARDGEFCGLGGGLDAGRSTIVKTPVMRRLPDTPETDCTPG